MCKHVHEKHSHRFVIEMLSNLFEIYKWYYGSCVHVHVHVYVQYIAKKLMYTCSFISFYSLVLILVPVRHVLVRGNWKVQSNMLLSGFPTLTQRLACVENWINIYMYTYYMKLLLLSGTCII